MKPLTRVVAILFIVVAATTARVVAESDEHSVTAALEGKFSGRAAIGVTTLRGLEMATGVLIEPDGSASGTLHALLHGTALGVTRVITVQGTVNSGWVGTDGRANFSGDAVIDLGDGTPPLPNVMFSVFAGSDGVALTIDSNTLPVAAITAGAIHIE
jgi:hypothetical protein